jgi:phosphoserine phosphatase RsbU/P
MRLVIGGREHALRLRDPKFGNGGVAYLKVEVGSEPGRCYELNRDEVTIGRHDACTILLNEGGKVSRWHAAISRREGRLYVRDMGSRNGTFLNDAPLGGEPQPLRQGDLLRLCDIVFVFYDDSPAARRRSSTASATDTIEDASETPGVVMVDELPDVSTSPIISKVDVSGGSSGIWQLTVSAEARLSALIEISRNLGRALALDEVLPQVLNSLFKIFLQADRGFIVLETDDKELAAPWTKARKGSEEAIRISRTIVRRVMESKEAVLSEDAMSEWTDISQSIADLRIRSMMCAPLLDSEGKALGVIQLDTLDQRKQFRREDLEVLASVGVQAGIAIHNAQLHEQALRQIDLERDLALAREVQRAFLPDRPPSLSGYRFTSFYSPANHVGGDYYDYIALPDGRTTILVADVVGHGVAAAMMMAKVSAEAKYCLASENHPATAMSKLNDRITMLGIDRFVTVIMVVLNHDRHEATIVNAGHMAPLWRRADGTIAEPGSDLSGLPVGILSDLTFNQITIQLKPGDLLLLYTDGVNEAMNETGKQYTVARLKQKVAEGYQDLEALRQALTDDLHEFTGGGPQADDICFVGLQCTG